MDNDPAGSAAQSEKKVPGFEQSNLPTSQENRHDSSADIPDGITSASRRAAYKIIHELDEQGIPAFDASRSRKQSPGDEAD